MSYTAPQYVDTKEQAVLALASTIAGEDKANLGDGSVNTALDVLADVLAGQDVDVPQTNAGAILALAQYVQGGGGASLTGNLVQLINVDSEPSGYPYNNISKPVYATAAIDGHTVAIGKLDNVIAGADITLANTPTGVWLVVPTSVTIDPNTGPSFEFTKTALTITGDTVHIPDDIPEPLTVEYEVEGETFTYTALPYIGIIVEGGSK